MRIAQRLPTKAQLVAWAMNRIRLRAVWAGQGCSYTPKLFGSQEPIKDWQLTRFDVGLIPAEPIVALSPEDMLDFAEVSCGQ
jgi:hypothetical protein